jgi:hypothetical protein
MSAAGVAFGVGSRVVMDAVTWKVIELEGVRVTLSGRGRHRCVDVGVLADSDDVTIDGRRVQNIDRDVELVQLNELQRKALERFLADRNEWKTGYRSGTILAAEAGEPRDPSPKRRLELIAARRGVNVATMYRKFREFPVKGAGVVVDRRGERKPAAEPSFDPRFRKIAERMLAENRDESTVHRRNFYIQVCAEVRNKHADGDPVPEPSREMFLTWLRRLPKDAHHFGRATTRRNAADAKEVDRHRGGLVASRPGEIVMIDSNRLDVLAIDPVSGAVLAMVWTMAWDLYTAWPMALRVTVGDPTAVDVALLLSDIVRPRCQGAAGRCGFWGVPDELIVRIGEGWGVGPPALAPLIVPAAILVDRAKALLAKLVRDAAAHLRCDVMEAHPRTGSDKAGIERNFGSIGTMCLEHLPGFKGSSVADRGRAPQDDDLLTPAQLEDTFWHWVEIAWQKRPHPGLRDRACLERLLSPEERYEIGIARAGFHYLPADRNLWLRLLPARLLKVGRSGLELHHLTFDDEVLDPYRRDSDLPGAGGRWRVRVDRRDLLHVWLEDHENDTFVHVPWKHHKHGDPLFGDRLLPYLKRRQTDLECVGLLRHSDRTLDNVTIEFARMIRADEITLAGAERVLKKALVEGRAAQRDAKTAGATGGDAQPERADAAVSGEQRDADQTTDMQGEQAGVSPVGDVSPDGPVDDAFVVDMRDDGPVDELEDEDDAATWCEQQPDRASYGWL